MKTIKSWCVYFDSGTTNSRIYLLDSNLNVVFTAKKAIGSKDSAIAGSNRILIEGLWELYNDLLSANSLSDNDIDEIYASGMVTSPYGLLEVPHLALPAGFEDIAESLVCFRENTYFKRDIYLVPGLKTVNEDISFVNNMRGEEIEIIGVAEQIAELPEGGAAVILPGSHTHIAFLDSGGIKDIVSNFTGELFHALKEETILSPVLSADISEPDKEMVKLGVENLLRFGFNRAVYICHAMRIFEKGSAQQRLSYGEGVLMGGVRQSLEYYCEKFHRKCKTAMIVSDEFNYKLFSAVLEDSSYIENIVWLPVSKEMSYAVMGLKKIIAIRSKKDEC